MKVGTLGPFMRIPSQAAIAPAIHAGVRAITPLLRTLLQNATHLGKSKLISCLVALCQDGYLDASTRERYARIRATDEPFPKLGRTRMIWTTETSRGSVTRSCAWRRSNS